MRYVALLRGINVGGRIVKMADLKICFEGMGFKDVSTVLQTGNVIFESGLKAPELKQKIEASLTKKFNYPAKAQVVSVENLTKIIKANPFAGTAAEYHQYVIFIENDLEIGLVAEAGKLLSEQVKVGPGVVYWKVKKGQTLKSQFSKLLSKSKYKDFNTTRNIKTLHKLVS